MHLYETINKYDEAVIDIIEKAFELAQIHDFNERYLVLQKKYYENEKTIHIQAANIRAYFKSDKEKHLLSLKNTLSKTQLPDEISTYSDGNIIDDLDKIEKYLDAKKYINEIELILEINIFSSYKSISNISRKKYPNILELLNKKKYAMNLKLTCPFCETDTNIRHNRRTLDRYFSTGLKCDCKFPRLSYILEKDNPSYNVQLINKLLNSKLAIPTIDKSIINKLHIYAKEKFPEFYSFQSNKKTYTEQKEFIPKTYVDKHIWSKVKQGQLKFNDYEMHLINKIPNATTRLTTLYDLNTYINNLEITMKSQLIKLDTEHQHTEDACITNQENKPQTEYIINPKFISYIENYETKKTTETTEQSINISQSNHELFALGNFCKSEGITMENLCQLKSMLNFCERHNIELYDLKKFHLSNQDNSDEYM